MEQIKVVRRPKLFVSRDPLLIDFLHDLEYTQSYLRLSSNPLPQHLLECFTIFRELLDALMKFVEGHLILQQCPSEFGLIVNERDLLELLGRSSYKEVLGNSTIHGFCDTSPACASSFLGTSASELFNSSRSDGEIVRKSQPASALISPVYGERSSPARWPGGWTYITEGSTHNDGSITVLLVVIEDLLDRLDTRILITLVILAGRLFVPVKDLEELYEFSDCVQIRKYSRVQRMGKSESRQLPHKQRPGRTRREE